MKIEKSDFSEVIYTINKKTNNNMKEGKKVKLKSGGPTMTISKQLENGEFECIWMENGVKNTESFPTSVLEEKTLTKVIKKEEALKIIEENDIDSYDFFENHHYCEKEFLDLEFIETQSRTYVRYVEFNLECIPLFKKTIQIKKGFFGDKKVEIKENTGYYIIRDYQLNVFFLIEKDFVKEKEEQRLSIIENYF